MAIDLGGSLRGKGLGQQTGGSLRENKEEAARLVKMLDHLPTQNLTEWEQTFLRSVEATVKDPGGRVTGKMVFKLRDIKDKLI